MLDMIGNITIAFFAIIGLVEAVKGLTFWLLEPKNYQKTVIVIPLEGHCDDVEFLLRNEEEKIKWFRKRNKTEIICVDYGMDLETRRICELFMKEKNFFKLCNAEKLSEMISH